MSPSELEQYLQMEPMPSLRLTLSSGDQIIIKTDDEPFVVGLSLILRGDREAGDVTARSRLVSVPNIALAEPIGIRPSGSSRRRRI